MFLVQILLPLSDKNGHPFAAATFHDLNARLTETFGGVTAYSRAPAKGQWSNSGAVERDDIIIVEVMTDALDRQWWADLRRNLETALEQDEIIIRALGAERL